MVRLVVAFRDTRARERADRDRADLVSTVAHEIRSPLTTVKGFTSTLLAKWDRLGDEQKLAMLAAVNADADRVTRLLSDLLDVSRIDAGRLRLRLQVVDVPAAVRRVIAGRVASGERADRFAAARRRGAAGDLAGPRPGRPGPRQPGRERGPARRRHRRRRGRGRQDADGADAVLVTVTDEGAGVDDEIRSRIFSRFWRGGHAGGSGLGLYIVKGIVEAHHGTVEVDAAPAAARASGCCCPPAPRRTTSRRG